MDGIVIEDSPIVDRFSAAWARELSPTPIKLVKAEHLIECPRKIVTRVLYPQKIKVERRDAVRYAMDCSLRCRWMSYLEHNFSFQVIARDLRVEDGDLWLQTIIEAKLKVDSKTVVVIFRHVSTNDMYRAKNMGPKKRDVVTVAASAHMSEVHDGIIVYGHGEDCCFYHIGLTDNLLNPIRQKCRVLSKYLLTSQLPPKCSSGCSFCNSLPTAAA